MADPVCAYLNRRSIAGPWRLDLPGDSRFTGGIIIPALAESPVIPELLGSLRNDETLVGSGFAVIVVVNNREHASESEKEDNRITIELLRRMRPTLPFPLGIIDASSPGFSLPDRVGGVGMARKLGHDLLLSRLEFGSCDPILVSLDCDTLVEPGYAGAIATHFRTASAGGAVIPFVHQAAFSEREEEAIVRYELFLRCYVAGLRFAGSPYAFHTVGSAMACRASAYLKCGGMNRRQAGEDFYFLQSLAKTSGVVQVEGALVRPSPRRSGRVPFGTGKAMGALLDSGEGAVLFYRPECFRLLQGWLALAEEGCRESWPDLVERGRTLSLRLYEFLLEQGFHAAWDGFLRQHRGEVARLKAFHDWFDAFRTMKFLHWLAEDPFPRSPAEETVNRWPSIWGGADLSLAGRLALLRQWQGGSCRSDCC